MFVANIRPVLVLFFALTLITGFLYPVVVTGIARVAFPRQASGSLVERNETVVGSTLIGQSFAMPNYFWSRPSATAPYPYNAAASSGSNQGPLNPALTDTVKARVDMLRAADPNNSLPIPVDLVTASASGLDPHISISSARFQAERVARARGLGTAEVDALIEQYSKKRLFGFLGEPHVNVLQLNLALDATARPK